MSNAMHAFLDRKSAYFLLFFVFPCLFFPKINVFQIANQTAGLRIDDVIILFFCFAFLPLRFASKVPLTSVERWFFLFVAFGFFSLGVHAIFWHFELAYLPANPLYNVRFFEYFLFFYVGWIFARYFSLYWSVFVFVFFNIAFILLQKLDVLGGFATLGYQSVADRPIGLSSFPNEIAALFSILFCFLIYDQGITDWIARTCSGV